MSRSGNFLKNFETMVKDNLSPSAKKIIGAILFLIVVGILSFYVFAIRGIGIIYKLNEDGESYRVEKMGISFETDVLIPAQYKDLPVTAVGKNAFSGCKNLKSIILPDTIESIGAGAFSDCKSLEAIEIPYAVTVIEDGAFKNCESLKYVQMGNDVTSIGADAFSRCRALTSFALPKKLSSIGKGTFIGCSKLESINIPYEVVYIGQYAFDSCHALDEVYFYNPEHWRLDGRLLSYLDLQDPEVAAKYLTEEYSNYEWKGMVPPELW